MAGHGGDAGVSFGGDGGTAVPELAVAPLVVPLVAG